MTAGGGDPPRNGAAEEAVRVRVMQLDAIAQAVGAGVIAALGVLVATNWLVLKGGRVVGPNLALLAQFFPGYRVTFVGSLIGALWAFIYAAAAGYVVSRVYNRFAGR
jgi:hypothetical protein